MINELVFQFSAALILFTGFGISFYFRRKADKESGETISRKVDGTALMTIIKIGGLILWISPLLYIINPDWMSWSKMGLAEWIRLAAVDLGIICVVLIYWLFKSIGSGISPTSATRTDHKLVTTGPYRWVRHPLYTIGTLNFTAFGLIADNWFYILLSGLVFIVMAIRTPKEEHNLIEKFGNEYREYMKRTGRFFPRLKK